MPCERELPRVSHACPVCATPYADIGHIGTQQGAHQPFGVHQPCGACQKDKPPFRATHALFHYRHPVDRLITRLKFGRRLELAHLLGTIAAHDLVGRVSEAPDMVLPVPLHKSRLRERGFSQALEIARPIARAMNVPIDILAARRVRKTLPQARLGRESRASNVRGAFAVSDRLAGRRIAIVDDVMTSGQTVTALADALRRAGCADVQVWVIARA
jgi:ComF family protein